MQLLCYCQSLALAKYSHTLRNTRVLYEVLRTVQRQRIGNAVFLGVLHYITLEEAKVDNMDFRIPFYFLAGLQRSRDVNRPVHIPTSSEDCIYEGFSSFS